MNVRDRALQIINPRLLSSPPLDVDALNQTRGALVPSDMGDPQFAKIIGDMYTEGPNAGTTCGFLPSYVWEQLGLRAAEILNRNVPGTDITYHIGQNISKIVNGAKALGAWRPGAQGMKPGDVIFMSNGPAATEHVDFFIRQVDPTHILTGDTGQTNAAGRQAGRFVLRTFDGQQIGTVNGPKTIQGYVDLEALPIPPSPPSPFTRRRIALVAGGVAAIGLVALGVHKAREEQPPLPEAA